MNEQKHFGRWLVIGLVSLTALAVGAFVAMRPLAKMRIPRVPTLAGETPKLDPVQGSTANEPTAGESIVFIEGDGSSNAPGKYPVKVNQRSGIYHLQGDLAYERTVPSRFYVSAEAAEADGFRHALR